MGRWPDEAPPLSHYVGALDKMQLMKYNGMWNYEAGEPRLQIDLQSIAMDLHRR